MTKKQSAERGYMTPEEVQEHLKGLSYKGKVGYLNQMLINAGGRFNPKTRESIYRTLSRLTVEKAMAEDNADFYDQQEKAFKEYNRSLGLPAPPSPLGFPSSNQIREEYHELAPHEKILYEVLAEGQVKKAGAENLNLKERAQRYALAASYYENAGMGVQAKRYMRESEKVKKLDAEVRSGKRTMIVGLDDLLRKSSPTTSIIGIFGGLFFLSSNITGNAIGNVSNSTSSVVGVCLLVVGLIAASFWIKNRDNLNKRKAKK